MKYQVAAFKLPFESHNVLSCDMPQDAEVIGNFIHHESKSALDATGVAPDEEHLVVILSFDPDAPLVRRNFARIKCGQIMSVDATLRHVCTFTNRFSGEQTALFEAELIEARCHVTNCDQLLGHDGDHLSSDGHRVGNSQQPTSGEVNAP